MAYIVIVAIRAWLSVRYARSQVTLPEAATASSGPVTVLQPILGGDPSLASVLKENLTNASASTRFIWLVDEDDATGQAAAESAASNDPHCVDVHLCPPARQSMNPKASKLRIGLAEVDTPFVAVLDDDTAIDAATLASAVAHLQDCELYTGLPCYRRGTTIWSSLVAHLVNSSAVTTYLPLLTFMSPITINGMFYVMRTDWLRNAGGFEAVEDQLCDDYAVAKLVRGHGGTLKQGTSVQYLQTHVRNRADYIRLMRRWFIFANQLVDDQPLKIRLLLIVMLALPPTLLWIGIGAVFSGVWGIVGLVAVLFVRHGIIRWTHRCVYPELLEFNCLHSLVAELLQPFFWLLAYGQRTFRWRTRRIRMLDCGRFEYVDIGVPRDK